MAGYYGFSMSNNAVAAYDDGLVPASKVRGVPAALVREFCRPAEWHHTSKNFNRTDFFNPTEVRAAFGLEQSEVFEVNPKAVAALAGHGRVAETIHTICRVEWIEWSGSLRRPKATNHVADGCTVVVKGQTATVTLPTGATFIKRLTTNGFRFRKAV